VGAKQKTGGFKMKVSELKEKRFKVYVGGEVERTTNWKGVEKLMQDLSDVPAYSPAEKAEFLKSSARKGYVYIDADITAKVIGR